MAEVLAIDSEPETLETIVAAGHTVHPAEMGYRTAKRRFIVAPHEVDLILCDLKKPACYDSTFWGPGRTTTTT